MKTILHLLGVGLLLSSATLAAKFSGEVSIEWQRKLHAAYASYLPALSGREVTISTAQFSGVFDKSEPWKEPTYRLRMDKAEISLGANSGAVRFISFDRTPPSKGGSSAGLSKTTNDIMVLATNYCNVFGLKLDSQLRPREVITPRRGGVWSFSADRFVGNLRHNAEGIYFSIADEDGRLLGMSSWLTSKSFEGAKLPKASVVDARVQAKDYMQKLFDLGFPSDKFERVTPGVAATPELVIDIPQKYQDRLKTNQRNFEFRKQPLEPRLVYIVGVTNNDARIKGHRAAVSLPSSWVCVDAETGVVIGN